MGPGKVTVNAIFTFLPNESAKVPHFTIRDIVFLDLIPKGPLIYPKGEVPCVSANEEVKGDLIDESKTGKWAKKKR